MDIFIAHQMAKKICPLELHVKKITKKFDKKDNKKDTKNFIKIKNTCEYCGQNYYWCLCDCT